LPRKCSVCEHIQVKDIDELLVNGIGLRKIAERFSLSTTSTYRHKAHINRTLLKANEVREVAQADNLLKQVRDLQTRALNVLLKTEESEDWRAATGAIREARGCLELLCRLAGELKEVQTVNIIVSPQWIEVRAVILETLAPYPEARISLSKALERIANGKIST